MNDGGPAFARAGSEDRRDGDMPDGNRYDKPCEGMSLRDWFAGQALAALTAAHCDELLKLGQINLAGPDNVAKDAYLLADAMLAAREKGETI
jgi:hypothetical protein